tara:strand:+ start:1049 stop:1546 length:498 start_codon:yes stop_codon:yes gene_type:complete
MKNSPSFRGWYYFRMGWATYFAFIFAAINTLTVTYFLAVEKYPVLVGIFPNFLQYVVIMGAIGIPILILAGYVHYKRTQAFKSEADVLVESNPYQRRNIVNIQMILELMLKTNAMLLKLTKNEKLNEDELNEIIKNQEKIEKFTKDRTFSSQLDLDYLKKQIQDS